jgi:organizing structure protein 2
VEIAPVPGSIVPTEKGAGKNSEGSFIKTETIGQVSVKSSDFLEKNVEIGRKWLHGQMEVAQKQVDERLERYLRVEKDVTSTVASLRADNEDILPGGIYVLISTLTGSILARRRGILIRATAPVLFGLGAFRYFLPGTYRNTGALIWSFEQRSPAVADAHLKVEAQINDLSSGVQSVLETGQSSLESGVHKTREFIADTTGLQVGGKSDRSK